MLIKKKWLKKGFTLIEILLVIGIIALMSTIKIRDINEENQSIKAKMLADQIKTVEDATNAFLVLKYNDLSQLSSDGVQCDTKQNTCNLTLKNLSDSALLPPNFSNKTILGNPYEIQLKRTGTAPNYMISGVVLTKDTINNEQPSSVFAGEVLKNIGKDGGLNNQSGKIVGTSGGWSSDSSSFPILAGSKNYIGSSIGTLSGAYYVYLRRDGTLPMTGDLNMDGHNIKNINNLTATGNINSNGNITGGNLLSNGNLSVSGISILNGNVQTNNSISVAGNGQFNGTINSNQRITGRELYSNSETYTNNWFRTMGDGGIYFQKYGGGWYMTDSNTVRTYAGKNIATSGEITAGGNIVANGNITGGSINSNGRLTTNEFVQINGVAGIGAGCSPNGLQGRTSDGHLLSCVSGRWTQPSSGASKYYTTNYNGSCTRADPDTSACHCSTGQMSILLYTGKKCESHHGHGDDWETCQTTSLTYGCFS